MPSMSPDPLIKLMSLTACAQAIDTNLIMLPAIHCCMQLVSVKAAGWSFELSLTPSSDPALADKYRIAEYLQVMIWLYVI